MLTVELLGPLQVSHGGEPCALPPSRKTRALLGYLAATGRAQRRDRLCELFWDAPDDPRGALRWSLSKLRAILDRPPAVVVAADRDTAQLKLRPEQVDYLFMRAALRNGVDGAPTEVLEALARRFRGPFLADIDLPHNPELQSWIVAAREEARRLQAAILTALDDRHAGNPQRALPYARELVQLEPYLEDSWARLLERLAQLGRRRELKEQYAAAKAALADTGGVSHRLEQARRRAGGAFASAEGAAPRELRQDIRFCRATDGVRLAYAVAGDGPPLVKAANWLNHLEYDWESPVWSHFLHGVARNRRLLRYDTRGNGLSDREVPEVSFDRWVRDLETVVDAAGYERFPLLGVSQGCAISIAYAVRHPERVSHLVLYAGFAAGAFKRGDEEAAERRRAMITLMRFGWGQSNPAFRQMFTTMFIPDATREQMDAFNELQRRTASPEFAARHYAATAELDVRHLLHQVSVPTLVMHSRGDALTPMELGRQMAAAIPGARFVPLPGSNHLFLEGEPAAGRFFEELELFLAE